MLSPFFFVPFNIALVAVRLPLLETTSSFDPSAPGLLLFPPVCTTAISAHALLGINQIGTVARVQLLLSPALSGNPDTAQAVKIIVLRFLSVDFVKLVLLLPVANDVLR